MRESESTPLLTSKVDQASIYVEEHQENLHQTLFSRWQAFTGVLFYVSIVGTTYAFAVYSKLLEANLNFTQTNIDIVASVGNTGLYLSLVAGFILEAKGIKFLIRVGALLIFTGFLYIFLAVQELVPANVASISVLYFLSQFGVCCHVSSAVTFAVKLFPPESRGAAVGLAKGYFGLSSAVLGDFAGGYFSNYPVYFILFTALVIPLISIVGSSVVNPLPSHMIPLAFDEAKGVSTSLLPFFLHWGCLFLIILTLGYMEYAYDMSQHGKVAFSTLLAIVLISLNSLPDLYGNRVVDDERFPSFLDTKDASLPLDYAHGPFSGNSERRAPAVGEVAHGVYGPISGQPGRRRTPSASSLSVLDSDTESLPSGHRRGRGSDNNSSSDPLHDLSAASGGVSGGGGGKLTECFFGKSVTLWEAVQTWRFWIIYVAFFVLIGTGLMVIDNINAIAVAVDVYPSSFFVTLVSLANGLGRVSAGFASDWIVKYISKLQLLSLVTLLMGISHAMFALGIKSLLYPSLLLVGFLFGSSVSLVAVNMADLFGHRHIATTFGAIDSAPIFGSYFFVTALIAIFYKTNTTDDGGDTSCVGADCFRIPFAINAVCCFAVMCALYITHIKSPMRFTTSEH